MGGIDLGWGKPIQETNLPNHLTLSQIWFGRPRVEAEGRTLGGRQPLAMEATKSKMLALLPLKFICVFGILCRKDIILEVQGLSLVKKHLKHEGCQSKIIVRSHLFNTTLDNTTTLI